MAMSNQEKLELVITARNLTQAEFDKLANSLKTTTTQANAAQASMGKFAKVREPLMRLASGPLQQLMGSFGAFIRLAATLPKAVLGPIGLLIGLIMALESKFNIIAKIISSVKVAFEALASFDFSGLGKSMADIWKGTKEKAEAAVIALYLPEQLSEADIKKLINDVITETNASGSAGMGLVMKVLQPKIAGKADGGLVSALVKAALAQ
jgi:uncharacterized protein YqeY